MIKREHPTIKAVLMSCIALLPILFVGCLDSVDDSDVFIFNDFRTTIGVDTDVAIGDTVWITGTVSSLAFNLTTQDSAFAAAPPNVSYLTLRLMEPGNTLINAEEGFAAFEPIANIGTMIGLADCQNTLSLITPELSEDESSYYFEVGLVPRFAGDYVFSWVNTELTNVNRNTAILNPYELVNFPRRVNFSRCNDIAFRDLSNSQGEFFFSVTE